jgi:transglutaminase-like putative cysteine protease/tetratricopeptide (TPR) repeat protein
MRIFACLLVLAATAYPLDAADWPVPRGPSHEPEPFVFDSKKPPACPKEYLDDYGAVVLYSSTSHRLLDDGTLETTVHEVTKLNGRKAVEDLGEYHYASYMPGWQKFMLHEARIHKADGAKVDVEPNHVSVRDSSGDDALVYDVSKQVTISFPNLAVGDVYEVKWSTRGKNPEFGGEFFTRYTFGDDRYPVVRDVWHVQIPKSKPLHVGSINASLKPEIGAANNARHYRWTVTNRLPPPKEDDAPSKDEYRWQGACSTFADWQAVAAWKSRVRAHCWKCDTDVQEIVRNVCKDLTRPQEKASALTYWVRRNVRYLSRGPGGAGYTPHPPTQVVRNRFGDCKDQCQLLAVMLREVGIDPWLVTLGAQGDGQVLPGVPSPWGTHAILLAEIDGKEHWIDPTYSDAPWNFLGRSARDRRCYLTRGDDFKLAKTPTLRPSDWQAEQRSQVQIQLDGATRIFRAGIWKGAAAVQRRNSYFETPRGERMRNASAEIRDAFPKARLWKLNFDEASLDDPDRPVGASAEFVVPKQFSGDEELEGSFTDSVVWNRFLGYAVDLERKLPLDLGYPFEASHRFSIELPPGYRLESWPSDVITRSEWGEFERKAESPDPDQPRIVRFSTRMRLTKWRVELADLRAFAALQEEVTRGYRVYLSLRLADNLSDVPLLEGIARRETAPHAARVLAKLLLRHGKRDEAAQLLATALEKFPSDRNLWELRTRAAQGGVAELDAVRLMSAQFPADDELKARLGTLLVRQGLAAEARKVLTPLLGRESTQVRTRVHLELAQLSLDAGDPVAAQKHWDAAELNDASSVASANALLLAGTIRMKTAGVEKALGFFRRAKDADPTRTDILMAFIDALIRTNQKKEALPALRALSVLVENERTLWPEIAMLHLRMSRADDAADFADQALDKSPESAIALTVRGVLSAAAQQPRGIADLESAIRIAKTDARPAMWLTAIHQVNGDMEKADQVRQRIPGGVPDETLAEMRRAIRTLARIPTTETKRP